jgi:hypothetical protein
MTFKNKNKDNIHYESQNKKLTKIMKNEKL